MRNRLTPAQRAFNQLKRAPSRLEDRREYAVEDLARAYPYLSTDEARALYELIQAHFRPS